MHDMFILDNDGMEQTIIIIILLLEFLVWSIISYTRYNTVLVKFLCTINYMHLPSAHMHADSRMGTIYSMQFIVAIIPLYTSLEVMISIITIASTKNNIIVQSCYGNITDHDL